MRLSEEKKVETNGIGLAVIAKNPVDAEARRRVAGFFALLLEVDRRLHPKQYQRTQQKQIKNRGISASDIVARRG